MATAAVPDHVYSECDGDEEGENLEKDSCDKTGGDSEEEAAESDGGGGEYGSEREEPNDVDTISGIAGGNHGEKDDNPPELVLSSGEEDSDEDEDEVEGRLLQHLQIITLCDEEKAKRLLAQTHNDLMLAVEIFFAMEQGSADDTSSEDGNRTVMNSESEDQKNESYETGVKELKAEEPMNSSDQTEALQWPLPLPTHADVEDSQNNLLSKLKRELMIEAVVISLSSAYPVLHPGYLRHLAMQFKGKEVKVHKYLSSVKETGKEPDSVLLNAVGEEYPSSVSQLCPSGYSLQPAADTKTSPPLILTPEQYQPSAALCEAQYGKGCDEVPRGGWNIEWLVGVGVLVVIMGVCTVVSLLFCNLE